MCRVSAVINCSYTCTVSGNYLVGGAIGSGWSGHNFTTGSGTVLDPYIIYTAQDLDLVREALAAHYRLGNNINLSSYENWEPIGDASDSFTGSFDGNGYTISSLTSQKGGLFGHCVGTEIKNCGVINVSISGYGGSLANSVYSTSVSNCYTTGSLQDGGGGLLGYAENSSVSHCNSSATVIGEGKTTAGLIGEAESTSVSDCFATGAVSGWRTGGLIGITDRCCFVSDSYATGMVSGGLIAGGLIADCGRTFVNNCYVTGNVTVGPDSEENNSYTKAGGLIGLASRSSIYNSYATGNVNGGYFAGGLIGLGSEGTLGYCYALNNSISANEENINRVMGASGGPMFKTDSGFLPMILLIGNYANQAMQINGVTCSGISDGASLYGEDIANATPPFPSVQWENNPPLATHDSVVVGNFGVYRTIFVCGADDEYQGTNPDFDPDGDYVYLTSITNISCDGAEPASINLSISSTGNSIKFYNGSNFIGTITCDYTITDLKGGFDTATLTIKVIDNTPPELTLFVGNVEKTVSGFDGGEGLEEVGTGIYTQHVYMLRGDTFVEPGGSVRDLGDGLISWEKVVVDSNLNTNNIGFYRIDYSVSDSAGNTTTACRLVKVLDPDADEDGDGVPNKDENFEYGGGDAGSNGPDPDDPPITPPPPEDNDDTKPNVNPEGVEVGMKEEVIRRSFVTSHESFNDEDFPQSIKDIIKEEDYKVEIGFKCETEDKEGESEAYKIGIVHPTPSTHDDGNCKGCVYEKLNKFNEGAPYYQFGTLDYTTFGEAGSDWKITYKTAKEYKSTIKPLRGTGGEVSKIIVGVGAFPDDVGGQNDFVFKDNQLISENNVKTKIQFLPVFEYLWMKKKYEEAIFFTFWKYKKTLEKVADELRVGNYTVFTEKIPIVICTYDEGLTKYNLDLDQGTLACYYDPRPIDELLGLNPKIYIFYDRFMLKPDRENVMIGTFLHEMVHWHLDKLGMQGDFHHGYFLGPYALQAKYANETGEDIEDIKSSYKNAMQQDFPNDSKWIVNEYDPEQYSEQNKY